MSLDTQFSIYKIDKINIKGFNKKVLIPAVSMVDYGTILADLMTAFQIIPYSSAKDAVFKALGVE